MKLLTPILSLGLALASWGCATPKEFVVGEPVGPSPMQRMVNSSKGTLQVFSARTQSDIDLNAQAFFWNNDFGTNNFVYDPAHSDYNLLSEHGKLLQRVKNARNEEDSHPARVSLPPGAYKIEADAEAANATTVKVIVPVVIKPGETTVVHLEPNWKPGRHLDQNALVRVYDGRFVGWRAESPNR